MARETPRIYATLEDQQTSYQTVVVKVEGKIAKKSIYVLIDPRSTHSYVNTQIIESCCLKSKKHAKS